ncbi:hypothetical protein BOX15_Mlig011034g2 [Macrostomum lignano]|uniref:Uncharacterized protein n=2 Tax=Macrostomum lignano TaxID=282301 RepID=A0A267DCJ5_9PLAT|nr:hypothetical protein BOX15_Mlig011034g2 [Macrostomum lignano]
MSEVAKRKSKRKSAAIDAAEDPCKLTPDEEAVAKALLWELPSKEGKLAGMKVGIFLADEAIEFLLKSRFASPGKDGKEAVIKDARAATQLMSTLLAKGLFQRALKLQKDKRSSRREDKTGSKRDEKAIEKADQQSSKEESTAKVAAVDDEAAAARERREKRARERQEKRKRGRPRLEIHELQAFVPNAGEVYIWHYDPTRPRNVVLGFLMVLGSILLCLFPMWPLQLRTGTYYLSIGALCLLGGLISLSLLRYPLFGLIWCLSLGRLHFWFLPNLTEDVGVLESFVPVISYDWSTTKTPAVASMAAASSTGTAEASDGANGSKKTN